MVDWLPDNLGCLDLLKFPVDELALKLYRTLVL